MKRQQMVTVILLALLIAGQLLVLFRDGKAMAFEQNGRFAVMVPHALAEPVLGPEQLGAVYNLLLLEDDDKAFLPLVSR